MNILSWIADPSLTTRLTLALLHFLWQGCCGGLLVAAGGTLFKGVSARIRYNLSVAVLIAMAACLPITFYLVEIPAAAVGQTARLPIVLEAEPFDSTLGEHQRSSTARVAPPAQEVTESQEPFARSSAATESGRLPA